MSVTSIAEYDVDITEIDLIHRYTFEPYELSEIYTSARANYGFVFIADGCADFIFEKKTIRAQKGSVLFIPSGTKYKAKNLCDSPFNHYTVNFGINPDKEKNKMIYNYLFYDTALVINNSHDSMFEKLFSSIESVWSRKSSGFVIKAKAKLYEIFYEFFERYEGSVMNKRGFERIKPAKDYIDNNYVSHISTSELSAMCGMSDTHFRRTFNEILFAPPLEYQMNLRIMRAKDLLVSDAYTVFEVAEMCGFQDQNYFSRIFKSRVGISPLKYKKDH